MKEKTIRNEIKNKVDDLISSVKDEEIKKLMKDGIIVTGGCIVSMLEGSPINDFDIYFRDIDTAHKVGNYYVKKFLKFNEKNKGIPTDVELVRTDNRLHLMVRSSGIIAEDNDEEYKYFEQLDVGSPETENFVQNAVQYLQGYSDKKNKYKPLVLTSNAITLSNNVQLITRFFGSPEEIHNNFDFIHCTNYWTSWNNELVLRQEALVSIMTKELKYFGSLYPICSMFRIRKYLKRGYTINAGQILKIAYQISKLDLDDVEIMQNQLIGVDASYFFQLLEIMKIDIAKGIEIDEVYLGKLIDEIF